MPIPFKNCPPNLPDNYSVAESRLESLGKRLCKNSEMMYRYTSEIKSLVEKGFAEKVSDNGKQPEGKTWYLPHHSVVNINKPEKLRVVFDCAAKYAGTSLNDAVMQGPDLTNKLVGVLCRFRQGQVAVMADVEAMFHQVRVCPDDRDALRFLWWQDDDITRKPEIYRMTVHLFGGVWSPSCANFALRRTAFDHGHEFDPDAAQTVLENFYVDDCLKSVNDEDRAVVLVKRVSSLLEKRGFRLTKWVSSNLAVLDSIPPAERAKEIRDLDLDRNTLPVERALGVEWDTETDQLRLKVRSKDKPMTRRGLISIISATYDPLGCVCPFILQANKIFQDETRAKKGWDEPLEQQNVQRWKKWLADLPKLQDFKVPRCVVPADFGRVTITQLHHFSDASTEDYGAVSYIRMVNSTGRIHCAFLIGKSRLVPIKQMTIPRLELAASVISVKLDRMLRKELKTDVDESIVWTDSTTVLHYVKNESKRFHTFVSNRIALIHDGSSPSQWRYVDSKRNPADDVSQGLGADEMTSSSRWKDGPDFLWDDVSTWPEMPNIDKHVAEDDREVKREVKVFSAMDSVTGPDKSMDKLIDRYSSWYRLKRAVAWLLRFKQLLLDRLRKKDASHPRKYLQVCEIKTAEVEIIRTVQRKHFGDELKVLVQGKSVKRSSDIFKLEPVMNSDYILCVGGRLHSAPIGEEAKHQIILPKDHHIVTLIIRQSHENCGHSGKEHVLSEVRKRFWIIKARVLVSRVLRDCVHCKRRHGPLGVQKMVNLPSDRVTPGKPVFTDVGLDAFGPFMVKRGRSLIKRYGCIFTCLSVRAVHIEKIDTMDTDSFIDAFKRFECRRGRPERVRSDNGSNFKGGERELREGIQGWNRAKINEYMCQKEIQWEFNPLAASHMGGVWERQIRTVRKVLTALLSTNQPLDDEGLNTLFCEVESIINSRPISVVSDDPRDLNPLTPNHLLLLRSRPNLPVSMFTKEDVFGKR